MKHSTTTRLAGPLLLLAAAFLPAFLVGACSSSEDAPATPNSGTVIAPREGAASDASDASDGGADAWLDAGPRICSDDGFCHSQVPKGQSLRGVWGDGLGVVWAISNQGDVLRWDGTSWKIHVHLTGQGGLFSIFGTGPTDLWVATDLGLDLPRLGGHSRYAAIFSDININSNSTGLT